MNQHKLDMIFQDGWRLAWTLACCALVCCLTACSSDQEWEESSLQENEKAEVTFQISTRAGVDNPEDVIQTLRIYAFRKKKEASGVTYKVEGYAYVEPNATMATVKMIVPTTSIAFYLIANEKAAGTLLVNNQTPFSFLEPGKLANGNPDFTPVTHTMQQLESLTFNQLPQAIPAATNPTGKDETGKTYTNPVLPMTAVRVERVTKGSVIDVELTRSVAKMTMHFSKTGSGLLFLGRGVYLYNVPKFGYLFARTSSKLGTEPVQSFIQHRELLGTGMAGLPADYKTNLNFNDSYLHQRGGKVMLRSGYPDEPENYDAMTDPNHAQKLDLNRITANFNDPLQGAYQQVPSKSFYLFANPFVAVNPVSPAATAQPDMHSVSLEPFEGDGYYLKILAHQHMVNDHHQIYYTHERFYVRLPQVEANDYISLYSIFTLDGFMDLQSSWMVQEWKTGGGDITFN